MWLANQLATALDLDDPLPPNDQVPPIDPSTEDGTLVGEISKFGATFLSEGGALLKEMNAHVFSGAVVEVLAPSTTTGGVGTTPCETNAHSTTAIPNSSLRSSLPKTVGICGNEITHVVELSRCLARAGHNLAVAAPSKVAAHALGAFNLCAGREGRSLGIMSEALALAYRRDRLSATNPDMPIFVRPEAVFRTLAHSCDLVIVLGDDARVEDQLVQLRGAGVAALRLSSTMTLQGGRTGRPFLLGSTVRTVAEVLEHACVILASPPIANAVDSSDEPPVVLNASGNEEEAENSDDAEDGLGTYEVVDYTHVYGQW